MNIGTWNTRSINGKEMVFVNEVEIYKIAILGIAETKNKGQGIESDNLGSHGFVYWGVNTNERARTGVALLLKNNLYELCDFNFIMSDS